MHKLVYSPPGTLARASPATGPPFATRGGGGWQCRGRRLASRSRSCDWRRHIPIPPAPPSAGGGAAGGTSACGGKAVFEVTALVVMNRIGRRSGV